MLDSIHSSVGHFDYLVQCDERGLERGESHQQLNGSNIVPLEPVYLLASSRQTSQFIGYNQISITMQVKVAQ